MFYVANNLLKHRVNPGDVVWVVSVLGDCLFTLGRITVTKEKIFDKKTAAKELCKNKYDFKPHEAKYHLIVPRKDAEPIRLTDISQLAGKLRFVTRKKESDHLTLISGKVNAQQLQMMRRLDSDSGEMLRAEWEQRRKREKNEYVKTVRKLDLLEAADREVTRKVRVEQSKLRKWLFGGAETGSCAICGEEYPVELLIASHIKPRAKCSSKERIDPKNLAPMCVLGCDALFEFARGYLVVDDGCVRLTAKAKHFSDSLRRKIRDGWDGRECSHWSDSRTYFEQHSRLVNRRSA